MKKNILSEQEEKILNIIENLLIKNREYPSIRNIQKEAGYKSPRSVSYILNKIIDKGFLKKNDDGSISSFKKNKENVNKNSVIKTVNIPLVGMITCGKPIFAQENIECYIPVSENIVKHGSKYFFLRASGDSMDLSGINDGDLVLIKQQNYADEGQNIVALIGNDATIKEFHKGKEAIILKPKSSNKIHLPIIVEDDFQIQGIVIKSLSNIFN